MTRRVAILAGTLVLAGAVAAGALVATSDPAADDPPSATPAAPPTTDDGAVAEVDEAALRNMTVPGPTCLTDQAVTLVNGEAPALRVDPQGVETFFGIGNASFPAMPVVLADLDEDGVQDGAAVVRCWPGGNAVLAGVYALVGGASKGAPVPFGDGVASRWELGVMAVSDDGGELVVDYVAAEEDEPHCCSSIDATDRFRWNGTGFERTDRRITRMSDVAAELVVAVNIGDRARALELADPDVVGHLTNARHSYGVLDGCAEGGTFVDQDVRECFVGSEAGWMIVVRFEKVGAHQWFAVASTDFGGGL